jgi:hypothetical protein
MGACVQLSSVRMLLVWCTGGTQCVEIGAACSGGSCAHTRVGRGCRVQTLLCWCSAAAAVSLGCWV